MPSSPSPLLTAALLATGAFVGAGAASFFARPEPVKEKPQPILPPKQDQPSSSKFPAGVPPPSSSLETDLVDRRLLALAARTAGGAIEASGYPGPISDLLVNTAYVAAYDRKLRHPAWVAEHMTAQSLMKPVGTDGQPKAKADRSFSVFKEDDRIPESFRAKLSDYFRSGYDRGHMVAAADAKFSQQAMDETFYLSNICPQVGEGFNRDYWAHTEDFVRRLTNQFADVYVFTLPLYLPRKEPDGKWRVSYEMIGNPPAVAVPTHFAKVVLGVGKPGSRPTLPPPPPSGSASSSDSPALTPRGLAGNLVGEKWLGLASFVIPNAPVSNTTPLKDFQVPLDSVERATGLTLFPASVKATSKGLCSLVDCSIIVREFKDKAALGGGGAGGGGGGKGMQRSQSAPGGLIGGR